VFLVPANLPRYIFGIYPSIRIEIGDPLRGSGFPAPIFYRQSITSDLGAMAQRDGAKYLMLTHLGPSLGTARHNQWDVPGGSLTEADYRSAAQAGGFTGITIVGTDLASVRLPAK
jgi:ribonuclease Z